MKKFNKFLSTVLFLLSCHIAYAISEQPFSLAADFDSQGGIVLRWHVTEGNYLYQEHISIAPELGSNMVLGHVNLPPANLKTFAGGAQYLVYDDDFSVNLPLTFSENGSVNLEVSYQGCSALGFCYAPVHQRLRVSAAKQVISIDTITSEFSADLINDQVATASFLAHHSMAWIALAFLALGLLLSLTPCVLPMLPVLSSIIVGHGKRLKPARAFMLSLTYVLTMSVTYALLGLAVAHAGNYLQALWQETWVIVAFSALFILLALSMFGLYEFSLPAFIEAKCGKVGRRMGGGSYLTVIVMGFLATMILSPCVTAPLIGVLSYIALTGDQVLGAIALFSLSIGMGIPLLIIGTSAGYLLPRAGAWLDSVRVFFGVMLLGLAIYLLQRVLPGFVILLLWGVLLLIVSITLASFKAAKTGILKVCRVLGLGIFVYAVILLIGGAVGHESPFYVFEQQQSVLVFNDVATMPQLQLILKKARQNKKPVLLYFHASWCIACKEIESRVLQDVRVKRALSSYVLLKVDISKRSDAVAPIENTFDIVAPPTIIFIDTAGLWQKNATIVGAVSASFFLKRAGH